MGKKRRARWIIGAAIAATALFGTLAYVSVHNSTEAKLELVVAQIVDDYDFEFKAEYPSRFSNPRRSFTRYVYTRAPIGSESADEIVALLSSACHSCKFELTIFDEDHRLVTADAAGPLIEVNNFKRDVQGTSSTAISFIPDLKGIDMPHTEPQAMLHFFKYNKPGLWQRIEEMWPW